MSIASKQDSLLSSGLLNKLGTTDRGDLDLKNSGAALIKMAGNLITVAQKNLRNDGTNSTGDLEESIHIENVDIKGKSMSLDIVLLDRYKFINDGVKGVESGKGKYSFKTIYPNKKMATALLKWYRSGKARSTSIRKPLGGKTEKKNLRAKKTVDQAENLKSLAYATAVNIKKHGIKPTHFFTKAIKDTERKWKKEMTAGFRLDIIESLKDGNRT
jgi:hypothetical protein